LGEAISSGNKLYNTAYGILFTVYGLRQLDNEGEFGMLGKGNSKLMQI